MHALNCLNFDGNRECLSHKGPSRLRLVLLYSVFPLSLSISAPHLLVRATLGNEGNRRAMVMHPLIPIIIVGHLHGEVDSRNHLENPRFDQFVVQWVAAVKERSGGVIVGYVKSKVRL